MKIDWKNYSYKLENKEIKKFYMYEYKIEVEQKFWQLFPLQKAQVRKQLRPVKIKKSLFQTIGMFLTGFILSVLDMVWISDILLSNNRINTFEEFLYNKYVYAIYKELLTNFEVKHELRTLESKLKLPIIVQIQVFDIENKILTKTNKKYSNISVFTTLDEKFYDFLDYYGIRYNFIKMIHNFETNNANIDFKTKRKLFLNTFNDFLKIYNFPFVAVK